MKKLKILSMVGLFLFFIGCNDDEISTVSSNDSNATTVNTSNKFNEVEMLNFDTVEQLNDFITEINKDEKGIYNLADLLYKEKNHLSLLKIYNMTREESYEYDIVEKNIAAVSTYDPILLLLLNKNGEIRIQDYVFRINGDFVYRYQDEGKDYIKDFLTDYDNGNVKINKGEEIEYNKLLSVYMHENEKVEQNEKTVGYDYFPGRNLRMKSKFWRDYWWFYSSIGANTSTQYKKKFLWWDWWKNTTRYNRVEAKEVTYNTFNVFMNSYDPPTTISRYSGCYCETANMTFNWSVGVPSAPLYFKYPHSGETKHWAHDYNGTPNTISRNISY